MSIGGWMRKPARHEPDFPVVQIEQVSVRYNDGPPVLDGVTLQLENGERLAVVGPNGAGKTTLLKVIAGILPPSSGSAQVYGHRAGGHICIGYVPQRSLVDWSFPVTVADVVMMGRVAKLGLFRHPGRHDWEVVHDSLAQVNMQSLAERQIGELSGGQQQRVFIARALAQEAELLLMDEPLTGLDLPSQDAIFEILDVLRLHRLTVVVSTHDLHLAADRFDRLLLLNHRLIGVGPARAVLTPENLLRAYGGQMTTISTPQGELVLGDTCCEGHEAEEEHSHA